MVPVLVAGDTAHGDIGKAGAAVDALPAHRIGDAGHELLEIVEVREMQLRQLLAGHRADVHRDLLQVLGPLLRGDDDGLERVGHRRLRLRGGRKAGQDGRREKKR